MFINLNKMFLNKSIKIFQHSKNIRKISCSIKFRQQEQPKLEHEPKTTHFGFETVREDEKQGKVHSVFEAVANDYDIMNDAMSFGIHRLWKDIFIERLGPYHGANLLDVAGGTGDIAFRYIKYIENLPQSQSDEPSHVTIFDINQAMLDVGKKRAENINSKVSINWVCGNAEELVGFEDNSFSAYTIAFGIRNVTKIDKALAEAYRVLQPGGRFMCLEFSQVTNPLLQKAYDQYSFQVIPVLGQLIAGQWKAYQYLVESIRKFPNQDKFKEMIEDAGFRRVTYENLTNGVVAIHSGFKL